MIKTKTRILKITTSRYILVPNIMFNDSQFPFNEDDKLQIEAIGNKCIVSRIKNVTKKA